MRPSEPNAEILQELQQYYESLGGDGAGIPVLAMMLHTKAYVAPTLQGVHSTGYFLHS